MLYEIIRFELQYRAKRPETCVYFAILFFCSLFAVNFIFEGNLSPVKENAPHIIAFTMAAAAGIFMMITSLIMGIPVLRDFDYNTAPLLFSAAMTKSEYLFGRFLGSFLILLVVFAALPLGILAGEAMPWRDAGNLLPFNAQTYWQPLLYLVFPALLYSSMIFFASSIISRKLIVVCTQGILFFIAMLLARAIEDPLLSAVLDPFGLRPLQLASQFQTTIELNSMPLTVDANLIYNRFFWLALGSLSFALAARRFNFDIVNSRTSKKHDATPDRQFQSTSPNITIPPAILCDGWTDSLAQLLSHTRFHFQIILKDMWFWVIMICAIVIVFINSINLGTTFGVDSYPTTYLIVEELQEMSIWFFLIILVFFSGELIWKERDARMDLIQDALPVSDAINLTGKFLALTCIYITLMSLLIFSGIVFQTINGFYEYEPLVYFSGFYIEILPYFLLYSFIAFAFQVMVNRKFVAYILVLLFLISTMLLEVFGFDHGLFRFGGQNLHTYSEMNGYGHFLKPYAWFKLYWLAFCIVLFVATVISSVRGIDTSIAARLKTARFRLTRPLFAAASLAALIFCMSGGYIFYNTNVLNTYFTRSMRHDFQASYENTLKRFEYLPQPKIIAANLRVDLFPARRAWRVDGHYILVNKHSEGIDKIHVQKLPDDDLAIEVLEFSEHTSADTVHKSFGHYIYDLERTLLPGDSITMRFRQTFTTKGFVESGSDLGIVHNGTFLNSDLLPTLGYSRKFELRDKGIRADKDLPPRRQRAPRNDTRELANARSGEDGYQIDLEITVITDSDQIALAPGQLKSTWEDGNRAYFHYKTKHPIIDLYPIMSARYEVRRERWLSSDSLTAEPVDLEIYHHPGHKYNLDRMMSAMKRSLDYYSTNFSPYQYQHLRIVEFPRYREFAQSLPGIIPFSEGAGFILDIDDETDVDMCFFVTAHEVAHQWWGMQLAAANVQGRGMILESLAQYSALMVLKQHFPREKIRQFLATQQDLYLKGRSRARTKEQPLSLVEAHQYVHYNKGAINFYALQELISEDSVNLALGRFLCDWGFGSRLSKGRYATSADLLHYFREVTPDTMHDVIDELFNQVILYDNRIVAAQYSKTNQDSYLVELELEATKIQVDTLGNESSLPLRNWIEVAIYGEGQEGKEIALHSERYFFDTARNSLQIALDSKPTKASIDPFHLLIDRRPENNHKTLK